MLEACLHGDKSAVVKHHADQRTQTRMTAQTLVSGIGKAIMETPPSNAHIFDNVYRFTYHIVR